MKSHRFMDKESGTPWEQSCIIKAHGEKPNEKHKKMLKLSLQSNLKPSRYKFSSVIFLQIQMSCLYGNDTNSKDAIFRIFQHYTEK